MKQPFVAGVVVATVIAAGCSSPTTPAAPIGLSCPATITAQSPDGQPTAVVFTGITTVGGAPPVTISCTPADGSRFAVGSTPVTCTATDASHQNAACTLTVKVAAPPMLVATRFVAFGDSITWGEDGEAFAWRRLSATINAEVQLPSGQTYPGVLLQLLTGRYTRQTLSVSNQGWPGEMLSDPSTIGQFFLRTDASLYDVVLLMEGSNDVNAMDKNLAVEPIAIANLDQMVRDAKTRGQRVLLATIPPMNAAVTLSGRNQGARLVPEFNDRIRGVAAAENVPLVDVYSALNSDVPTFIGTADGLHPTAAGHARIAATFFTAIEQNLETTAAPASRHLQLRIRN